MIISYVINQELERVVGRERNEGADSQHIKSTNAIVCPAVPLGHVPFHPHLTCVLLFPPSRSTLLYHHHHLSLTHEHLPTLAALPLLCRRSCQSGSGHHIDSQKTFVNCLSPTFL